MAALIIGAFAIYSSIALFVFDGYPFCFDENSYLYQAELYASGRITEYMGRRPSVLQDLFVLRHQGHAFSKYAPGFSLLLSSGTFFGVPYLVNPLISAVSLYLLYSLTTSLLGRRAGTVAVIFMGTNPYFIGYAASYFAQSTALMLTLLSLRLLRAYELHQQPRLLVYFGMSVGFLFCVRPLDGAITMAISAVLLLWISGIRNGLRSLVWAGVPVFVFVLALCCYHYYVSGRFAISTYDIMVGEFRVKDPRAKTLVENIRLISLAYFDNFSNNATWLLRHEFANTAGPTIVLLALLGVGVRLNRRWNVAFLSHFVLAVLLYNFHPSLAWPQYGARYYYPSFGPVVVLAVSAWWMLAWRIRSDGFKRAFVCAFVALQAFNSYEAVAQYSTRFDFVQRQRNIIKNTCPDQSIVIVSCVLNFSKVAPEYVVCNNFIRNSRPMGGRVMVPDKQVAASLEDLFPSYPVCLVTIGY